jgi:hypothetical protein
MISRTEQVNHPRYEQYKKLGVVVHPEWRTSPAAFAEYVSSVLGPKPSQAHSLDRIDNNGNYEPGNIRWATSLEQANNRSTNIKVSHEGKKWTLKELAERYNLPVRLVRNRYRSGFSVEEILTFPILDNPGHRKQFGRVRIAKREAE